MVWDIRIGHHRTIFFNGTVTGESYLNLLQEFVGPQISEMFVDDGDLLGARYQRCLHNNGHQFEHLRT